MPGARFIDEKELCSLMPSVAKGHCILLDVRSPREHGDARIEHSRLMPLDEMERRYTELSPDAVIIVYCRSGPRSLRAAEFLVSRGFKDVRVLQSGIAGWRGETVKG